jgi:DNA replication and repair protein RecF
MRLEHLSLHNFRNYVRLELDLPRGITVLYGDNAQGKTNLLEAIYYLATSRSPLAGNDRELVNWLAPENEVLPYTRLEARLSRGNGPRRLEITLQQQNNASSSGARYQKRVRINGVAKRVLDLLGQLNVVLFEPEDVALVTGSPSRRRRYLDATLCQIDTHYCHHLSRYNRIVTQRNALLKDLRERGGRPDELEFWNDKLVEHGTYVVARRATFLDRLDRLARDRHADLTSRTERMDTQYQPSVELDQDEPARRSTETIRQAFAAQLISLIRREIAAGMTLIGPHRDEVRFIINGSDAGVFASRGQQRTTVLSIKLAEVELMRQETGERPVLLLDDVLSELDAHRQPILLQLAQEAEQALITTTHLRAFPASFLVQVHVLQVAAGRLHQAGHQDDLTVRTDGAQGGAVSENEA